jgi:hypothetical protein
MPDRHVPIDGYLVAEADIPSHPPCPELSQRDRLFLFGDERGWTLLTVRGLTSWRQHGPFNVRATAVCVTTYSDLAVLQALHTDAVWQALVEGAARRGVDLAKPQPPLEDL